MTPQEIIERCLSLSRAAGCIVIVDESHTANLRWANNSLTTNGIVTSREVTVVAVVEGSTGTCSGVVARSAVTPDALEPLVRAAEQAARDNGPADDANPLVDGDATPDWNEPAADTSIRAFDDVASGLGAAFGRARSTDRLLYGYVEHDITTTYVGTSTGLRIRHVQPTGHIGITGKSGDLASSAWVGQACRDMNEVDVAGLDAELNRRLDWSARRRDLPAGRYDTVLPPTAVADLLIYMYWNMAARDAHDGRTVFSNPDRGTRVGDRLGPPTATMWSDPHAPGIASAPFVIAHASGSHQSVFDTGTPLHRTEWIADGRLDALMQTRYSAKLTGLPLTPFVGNLGLTVSGASGDTSDLVAGVEHGLLLTCLWYIREVDPQKLLLTGLTRDGVYLVENGEVVGAVNNFRFNDSPVSLLDRFTSAGATTPTFSREWGDYFPRTAMPALRVPDFHMSSVSQAS